MNGVGNVGNKKFCLWPLRCRDLWRSALPGGLKQTAIGHQPPADNLTEPYSVILWWGGVWTMSTRVARSLAMTMWPCGHDHARAFVDNVDNVDTTFQSLAKWGGCELW